MIRVVSPLKQNTLGLRGIPFNNPQTFKAETNSVVLRKAASDNAITVPKHFIPCADPAFSICHYWSE